MKHKKQFGNTSVIPTSNYFFGMNTGEEIYVAIEPGKTLIIRYFTLSEPNEKGHRTVYFELNGQPRSGLAMSGWSAKISKVFRTSI